MLLSLNGLFTKRCQQYILEWLIGRNIYMQQPSKFVSKDFTLVCKLHKAIYSLLFFGWCSSVYPNHSTWALICCQQGLLVHAQSTRISLESNETHSSIPYKHFWSWLVHMSKKNQFHPWIQWHRLGFRCWWLEIYYGILLYLYRIKYCLMVLTHTKVLFQE